MSKWKEHYVLETLWKRVLWGLLWRCLKYRCCSISHVVKMSFLYLNSKRSWYLVLRWHLVDLEKGHLWRNRSVCWTIYMTEFFGRVCSLLFVKDFYLVSGTMYSLFGNSYKHLEPWFPNVYSGVKVTHLVALVSTQPYWLQNTYS